MVGSGFWCLGECVGGVRLRGGSWGCGGRWFGRRLARGMRRIGGLWSGIGGRCFGGEGGVKAFSRDSIWYVIACFSSSDTSDTGMDCRLPMTHSLIPVRPYLGFLIAS